MGSKAKRPIADVRSSPTAATLFVTGDLAIVREYAALCVAKGYRVVCNAHDGDAREALPEGKSVTVSNTIPPSTSLALELTNLDPDRKRDNIRRLDRTLDADRLILTSSLVTTATEQASWIDHPYRLIGMSALPGFSDRRAVEVAPTVSSPVESMEIARRFFSTLGMELEIVQDRVGMVLARLLCHTINEAAFAIQEGSASPADVDRAAVLAAGFPRGPLAWADEVGFRQIVAVLAAIAADLGEERYRVCPLLKQLSLGGQWHNTHPRTRKKQA